MGTVQGFVGCPDIHFITMCPDIHFITITSLTTKHLNEMVGNCPFGC